MLEYSFNIQQAIFNGLVLVRRFELFDILPDELLINKANKCFFETLQESIYSECMLKWGITL